MEYDGIQNPNSGVNGERQYIKTLKTPFISEPALRIGPKHGPSVHPSVPEKLSGNMQERTLKLIETMFFQRTLTRNQIARVLYPGRQPRVIKDSIKTMVSHNFIAPYQWGLNATPSPSSLGTPTYTLSTLGMEIMRVRGASIPSRRSLLHPDIRMIWKNLLANELWSHLVLHQLGNTDKRRLNTFSIFPRLNLSTGKSYTPTAMFSYTSQEGTQPKRFIFDVVRGEKDIKAVYESFVFYEKWFDDHPEQAKTFVFIACEHEEQAVQIKAELFRAKLAKKVKHLFTTDLRMHTKAPGDLGAFFDISNKMEILEVESRPFRAPEVMYL